MIDIYIFDSQTLLIYYFKLFPTKLDGMVADTEKETRCVIHHRILLLLLYRFFWNRKFFFKQSISLYLSRVLSFPPYRDHPSVVT